MHRVTRIIPLLATFFFVTTVSLDAVSHMHTHDNHGHEYECPFSNNKLIETDVSDPIERVEFSPLLADAYIQTFLFQTEQRLAQSRAPPKI